MSEPLNANSNSRTRLILLSCGGILAAAIAGFLGYSSICPCERTPGGFLFGTQVEAPIDDWSFANDVALCQLQIYAGIRPHSINLNCMATEDGQLYLSCSNCTSKYWASKVGSDKAGKLRLNDTVYPVTLNRVMDENELDRAWSARVIKLQVAGGAAANPVPSPDALRADHWWSFRVVSSI
ncbi:MAG: hypothetical protein COC19_04045 [SAR86 cluster bacterium]|uniref:Uncharacterized protein n=1 Tax=SAR86 cluster bacterium TaxID=2030880 RepID=A0A2A4MQ33_9GAMM|nr:MAG: hypothetical protein COC19_04045 [SAR86 cluster bacterium]